MGVFAPMALEQLELRREVVSLRQGVGVSAPMDALGLAPTPLTGAPCNAGTPTNVGPQVAVPLVVVLSRGVTTVIGRSGVPPLPRRSSLLPVSPAPLASSLTRDRNSVRELRDKLNGVEVFKDANQCAPMLSMVVGRSWEAALDEYALRDERKASIRELEALIRRRWRKVGDKARDWRQGKLYSAGSGTYWAFETEYARVRCRGGCGANCL